MKTYCALLTITALLFVACNNPIAKSNDTPIGEGGTQERIKEKDELNLSDFVPCTECEFEGKLVNPLPKEWNDAEKELYKVTIDFYEQTSGFLFTSEMIDLYASSGPSACHDRFIKAISGELQSTGNIVSSEDPIGSFGWRNRFDESAVLQMKASMPCMVEEKMPSKDSKGYDNWEKRVFKCIDVVFDAGLPVCFYVERPTIQDSTSAIVRLRLYDTVDTNGVPHLVSGYYLYFDKVAGEWLFSLRRDR
jgi:hypothetical protein